MKNRILIVDNDETILKSLVIMLREDYDVITAKSGQEALRFTQNQNIECIISDFNMDDGDGLFLLKNLNNKEIPFILMTGYGEKDLFKSFANANVFYIFEKPLTTDLSRVVKKAFEHYHKRQKELKEGLIGKNTGHILHDLANGLGIIEVSASAGLSRPAEASTYFSMAIRATRKITTMITKYKALMSGSFPIQLSRVDLNSTLIGLIEELKISVSECSFVYETSIPEGRDIVIDCDLFRQVILNLISNSVYAIKDSQNPVIMIRSFQDVDCTRIEIEDSGVISEDTANKLFKESFSTKKENGTGMGLMYCKDLLQRMGGDIRLVNRCPTTFQITFQTRS